MSFKRCCAYFAIYTVSFIWASIICLRLLLGTIRHPLTFWRRRKPILTPPVCMLDETLGKHEYVRANGIKFHYVTAGDKSKPLMLFLHGFPEFWYSWRHQIRAFSSDYHVVAVDLRGYGETDRPQKRQDYVITNLTQDIVQLIPALGHDDAILVAHDWGAAVAWAVAQSRPDLLKKLIVMNCPHPKAFKRGLSQMLKSWYIFFFQVPRLPELVVSLEGINFIQECFHGKEVGVRNKDAFTMEDIQAFKYVFSQPGAFTGPINYYRCIFDRGVNRSLRKNASIDVPTLLLWGDDDAYLELDDDGHSRIVKDITIKHVPNCSHWIQQDQPEKVNQYMKEFI